jgi:hypothetical protein
MWTLNQADFDRRETPPYTAEALALHKQREAEVEGGKVISDEGLKCLPQGMPGMMLSEFAIEILETPQRVTIISESSPLVRSVYLNRTKPTEGLEPMWNGYCWATGKVRHWSSRPPISTIVRFRWALAARSCPHHHADRAPVADRWRQDDGG